MRILLLVFAALCPFGNMSAADKYSMEEGFADANGLLIYYLQVGAGQPLARACCEMDFRCAGAAPKG